MNRKHIAQQFEIAPVAEVFNLAAETGTDWERERQERQDAERERREARRLKEKLQLSMLTLMGC